MKKLLLSLLISFSTVVLAETPKGFFGIELLKNAKQYVTDAKLAGKVRNQETIDNYYDFYLNPPEINPYFERYFLTVNNRNIIHQIVAEKNYTDLQVCLRDVNEIKRTIEKKYNLILEEYKRSHPGFMSYTKDIYFSNNDYLSLRCNERTSYDVSSYLLYRNHKFADDVERYYIKGF